MVEVSVMRLTTCVVNLFDSLQGRKGIMQEACGGGGTSTREARKNRVGFDFPVFASFR